jgi:predicted phosphodiesterase
MDQIIVDYQQSDEFTKERKRILDSLNDYDARQNYPIFRYQTNQTRVLFISDTHLGSYTENLILIQLAYEYARRNNIQLIIHGGDLLQGNAFKERSYGADNVHTFSQFHKASEERAYFLEKYPSYPDIYTAVTMGDHDIWSLLPIEEPDKRVSEIVKEIEQKPNIMVTGISKTLLNLEDLKISVNHINNLFKNQYLDYSTIYRINESLGTDINFFGHRHYYDKDENNIFIPSLSDDTKSCYQPGFLDVTYDGTDVLVRLISIGKDYSKKVEDKAKIRVRTK